MTLVRRFRAIAWPLSLILAALWLLIGCLYIPTPQRLHLTGSHQDFRPLVGHAGSQKAIVERRISRAAVEALLGPPPYASANGRRLLYVIHLKNGIWIVPLCFTVASREDTAVGLLLDFDELGILNDWKRIDHSGGLIIRKIFDPDAEARTQGAAEGGLVNTAHDLSLTGASSEPAPDEWKLRSTLNATRHQ